MDELVSAASGRRPAGGANGQRGAATYPASCWKQCSTASPHLGRRLLRKLDLCRLTYGSNNCGEPNKRISNGRALPPEDRLKIVEVG